MINGLGKTKYGQTIMKAESVSETGVSTSSGDDDSFSHESTRSDETSLSTVNQNDTACNILNHNSKFATCSAAPTNGRRKESLPTLICDVPLACNPHGSLLQLAYKLRAANDRVLKLGRTKIAQTKKDSVPITDNDDILRDKITAVSNELWSLLLQTDLSPHLHSVIAWDIDDWSPFQQSLWPILASTREAVESKYAQLLSFDDASQTDPPVLNDAQVQYIVENAIDFVLRTKMPKLLAIRNENHNSERTPRKHKCPSCSYRTDNKSHLRRHEGSVHSAVKPYACFLCGRQFARTEKLKAHFAKEHAGVAYQPKLCRNIASAKTSCGDSLSPAKVTLHEPPVSRKLPSHDQPEQQNSPTHDLAAPEQLTSHASQVPEQSPCHASLQQECSQFVTNAKITESGDMTDVVEDDATVLRDEDKLDEANIPGDETNAVPVVQSDMQRDDNPRSERPKYACPHCAYVGRDTWHLRRHLSDVHSAAKAFTCVVCRYSTSRRHRLLSHLRAHGRLSCPHCHFSTADALALETHVRVCPATYTCGQCETSFPNQELLREHANACTAVQVYDNQNAGNRSVFRCSLCRFTTKYQKVMRRHFSRHSGTVGGYVCAVTGCTFRATEKTVLQQHLRASHRHLVAEGEANTYPCPICVRPPFKYRRSLEKHIAAHREERICCPYCGISFYMRVDLDIHIATEHSSVAGLVDDLKAKNLTETTTGD